jgi:hypothetical protein
MLGLAGEIDGFDGVDAGFDGEVEGLLTGEENIGFELITGFLFFIGVDEFGFSRSKSVFISGFLSGTEPFDSL